jgi:hypothetical protein
VSAQRYTATTMTRARVLKEAGWSLRKIAELIEKETGQRPAATTVALWCYPEPRYDARRIYLNGKHAKRRRRNTMIRRTEKMRELYLRGVGLRAIGQVSALLWDEELSEDQVRTRLGLRKGEVFTWKACGMRLTDPQIRALEEVERDLWRWKPNVYWYETGADYRLKRSVEWAVRRGFAKHAGRLSRTLVSEALALTDSGHAALQEARG